MVSSTPWPAARGHQETTADGRESPSVGLSTFLFSASAGSLCASGLRKSNCDLRCYRFVRRWSSNVSEPATLPRDPASRTRRRRSTWEGMIKKRERSSGTGEWSATREDRQGREWPRLLELLEILRVGGRRGGGLDLSPPYVDSSASGMKPTQPPVLLFGRWWRQTRTPTHALSTSCICAEDRLRNCVGAEGLA